MANLNFPVDFTEKVKLPASVSGTGYPYRISAEDLMRDFYYAALTAEDGWIDSQNSEIYPSRKLKLPAIPSGEGLFVLGCSGGQLQWIETEAC